MSASEDDCVECKVHRLYDEYDLRVSGDLGNGVRAWDIIANVEEMFPVDDIRLKDGTRLWNLLRIFLYTFNYELKGDRRFKMLSFLRLIPYHPRIEHSDVIDAIVEYVCCRTGHDKDIVSIALYDYIKVFALLKKLYRFKYRNQRHAVHLSGSGYGRQPMAQAQACRELGIRCIERQHGVIDRFFPAYMSARKTSNHDCLPSYLVVFDEYSQRLVESDGLFENVLLDKQPRRKKNILFTGQWNLASATEVFIRELGRLLPEEYVLEFMPHKQDVHDYSSLVCENIELVDKDSDFFLCLSMADVHATVFSGRGMYSLVNEIPTIFVDLLGFCGGNFPVTAEDFVKELKKLC